MINILKSLNYGARREKVIWITLGSMLVLPFFAMYLMGMMGGDSLQKMTTSFYFASQLMGVIFIITFFGIIVLAGYLVAGDGGDKVINYEILAGHSRTKIFIARMLAGFLWGGVLTFLLMLLPLGYLTFLYGWGLETDPKNVILRCLLTFFPILRFCVFNMMLACIMRSAGKGIALGYVTFMITALVNSILEDMFQLNLIYHTSMTNAAFLLTSQNARNVVMNGKTVALYETAVTPDMVYRTIGVSLAFTAAYLSIAYIHFKKKDKD